MINDPRASCLGLTDLFYGPHVDLREEPQDDREAREARCRQVCAGCELLWPCLHWAISEEEPWGVWGGMPYQQRRHFRKFLKRRGGIPDSEEELQRLHHLFLVEEDKKRRLRTKAKTIGKSRNGARSVSSGDGARGGARDIGSAKSKAGNGSDPGRGRGGGSYRRAANAKEERNKGLSGQQRRVR